MEEKKLKKLEKIALHQELQDDDNDVDESL
jgi:hypothetical protein